MSNSPYRDGHEQAPPRTDFPLDVQMEVHKVEVGKEIMGNRLVVDICLMGDMPAPHGGKPLTIFNHIKFFADGKRERDYPSMIGKKFLMTIREDR